MREILFRGKDVDSGAWIYGYYIGPVGLDDSHEICDISDPCGSRTDVAPYTVGQYTGLTDSNGKKIFEGDIVRVEIAKVVFPSVCIFEGGSFGLEWEWSGRKFQAFTGICHADFEVIGNIHDNPGLLKGGEES